MALNQSHNVRRAVARSKRTVVASSGQPSTNQCDMLVIKACLVTWWWCPAGSGASDLAASATTSASRLAAVRLVTAADVAAGRYAVTDVVLPLPGTQVRYPTHETGQRMRQVRPGPGRLGLLRRYMAAHADF